MIAVRDQLTEGRDAVVATPDELSSVVNTWFHSDGVPWPSENVRQLTAAIARGDWLRAHALADHMSLDLDAV